MKKLLTLIVFLAMPPAAFAEDEAKEETEIPEAKTWVTEHSATIGGRKVDYKVTAGTMLMKNDEDDPIALVGFTAYEKKGANKRERPIMFAYNGGPGSASIWLHMGILGPQRAVVNDAAFTENGPYERVENVYSIIVQLISQTWRVRRLRRRSSLSRRSTSTDACASLRALSSLVIQ